MSKGKFSEYTTDDLISWRNSASLRVTLRDETTDDMINKIEKMANESHKDLKWILALNREINSRAFGYKKTIEGLV